MVALLVGSVNPVVPDWLMLDMIERLNSVADFDRSLMNANLILFAFAAWSGPCRQSLTTITAAYDRLCQSSLLLMFRLLK